MRRIPIASYLALCLILLAMPVRSGDYGLAALLPPSTIACIIPADDGALEHAYSNSILRRLADLPEMGAFFQSLDQSRRELAQDLANNAGISPEVAWEITNARLGAALLDITVDRSGNPKPELLVALAFRQPPDRQMVFNAVRTLLNRREVVRAALESQGIDPNLPLRTLAQEETIPGYPPMLRIGPFIRVAVVGNLVLFYHGPGSDGIKALFDAQQNPARSLAGTQAYQETMRGSSAEPGMAFTYVNVPRLTNILDAAGFSSITRVLDAVGLSSTQAVGLAGGYQKEGMRHNVYLYSPGGLAGGLLSSLIPMPAGNQPGVEVYSRVTPEQAKAFMALHLDFPSFLDEAPHFSDAVGGVTRPGGMAGFLKDETILGVPLSVISQVLGTNLVVRPHDDTQIALFTDIDVPNFERLIQMMEQNSGSRFRALDVGGYMIRYFNQRSDASLPLAPAFCLVPRQQQPTTGSLYVATHPQALVSLIRELVSAKTPISQTDDYLKSIQGLDGGYSLFYYNDCRDSYRRFYNAALPLASLWASSRTYPVDTGLLPTADSIIPGLFGCALGFKADNNGLAMQAYSPVGINAVFIILADRLIISNPLVMGYFHSMAVELNSSLPW